MDTDVCNGKSYHLVRDKILSDGVKLWLAPYCLNETEPSLPDLQRLSEDYSKSLNIPSSVCYESLVQLQANAVDKLRCRRRYQESGVATLKIKILRSDSPPQIISKELLLSCCASDLKNEISVHIDVPTNGFKLICNGKMLKDSETLHQQGIQNEQLILALALDSSAENLSADEARAKEIELTKADTSLLSSDDSYMVLEDQAGNSLKIPKKERKALVTAIALHEKGRTALKTEDYTRALSFFIDADAEFARCTSQLLETVDNYALLHLDIAWCYLCLQSVKQLPEARERLDRCKSTLQKSYGPNLERVIALKGTSDNEAVLLLRLHLLQGIVMFHENRRAEALTMFETVREQLNCLKVDENSLLLLVELGYSPAEARLGLRATHGDVNSAANYINGSRKERAESRRKALAQKIREREEKKLGKCDDGQQYVNSNFLGMLVNMGFHKETAQVALQKCNNKISDSIQYIQDNPGPSTSRSRELLSLIEDLIPELEAAGFDYTSSKRALEQCDGDVIKAANYLLSYPSDCREATQIEEPSQADLEKKAEEKKLKEEALERLSKDIVTADDDHLDLTLHQEEIFLQQYLSWLQD